MKKKNRDLFITLTLEDFRHHGVTRRLLRNQKGTEVLEFAIVSSLLLILVFGIIDFGILLYDKAVITNASREGARAGIVQRYQINNTTPPTSTYDPLDEDEIRTVVNTYVTNNLITFGGTNTATTSVNPADASGASSGDPRTVTVSYTYSFLAGIIAGPSIDLSATTIMRME